MLSGWGSEGQGSNSATSNNTSPRVPKKFRKNDFLPESKAYVIIAILLEAHIKKPYLAGIKRFIHFQQSTL